jgi:ribosomal protein L10
MGVTPEEVRQAKKFLENNKISIKYVKPNLFAIASNGLKKNFTETLNYFQKGTSGTIDSSDQKKD